MNLLKSTLTVKFNCISDEITLRIYVAPNKISSY